MKESLELSQQQRLQQRLHPEQMLYGRLLEMSTPEIEDEVRRVVDENPALTERAPEGAEATADMDETFKESASNCSVPTMPTTMMYRFRATEAAATTGISTCPKPPPERLLPRP